MITISWLIDVISQVTHLMAAWNATEKKMPFCYRSM